MKNFLFSLVLIIAVASSALGQRFDVDLDDGASDYAQALLASHGQDGRILQRQARTRPFALGFFGWKAHRLALLPYNKTEAVHINVCRLMLSAYGADPQLDPVLNRLAQRGAGKAGFVEATDDEKAIVQRQVVQKLTREFLFDFSKPDQPQPEAVDPLSAWKYRLGMHLGELAGMLTQWFSLPNHQAFADSVTESLNDLEKRTTDTPKEVPTDLVAKIRDLKATARPTYTAAQKREVAARLAALLRSALVFATVPPITDEIAKVPAPTPKPPEATPLPPKPTPVPPKPTPEPPRPILPKPTPSPSPIKPAPPAPVSTDDLNAGKQLASKGDHAGAIARFTAYLEKVPSSFEALLGRGISYYQIREYQNASDDLRRAAKLDDNSPEPHIWLARVLCAEGLPASASFREYEARRRGGVIESPCPPKK